MECRDCEFRIDQSTNTNRKQAARAHSLALRACIGVLICSEFATHDTISGQRMYAGGEFRANDRFLGDNQFFDVLGQVEGKVIDNQIAN